MDDNIRRKAYQMDSDENLFEEIFDEFSGIEPVDIHKYTDDPEVEEVEEGSTDDVIRSRFKSEVEYEDDDELVDDGIIKTGYQTGEVDLNDNEGVEFGNSADSLQDKIRKLERVNEGLKEKGVRRRYVLGDVDAPDNAYVYEDSVGKYFYKVNASVRPSDVPMVFDKYDSWFEIPETERVGATVVLLGKSFPWVVQDADSDDKVDKFLSRVCVDETDDLESEDVFSVEKIEEISDRLLDR